MKREPLTQDDKDEARRLIGDVGRRATEGEADDKVAREVIGFMRRQLRRGWRPVHE